MLICICFKVFGLSLIVPFNMVSGVRRLVIVEAGSKRVEGIVSLSDIFKFLLG